MNLAPIVLFVYNRPWHTQQTIEALQKNSLAEESELFIYSDAAKNDTEKDNVDEVRSYIKTIKGFKKVTIIEQEENRGLADSIISGVTNIVNKYGKIIVLEDDLVTSPFFLNYMNDALTYYEDEKQVWHISGWNYPIKIKSKEDVYLWRTMNCWGWATWSDRWYYFEKNIDMIIDEFNEKDIKKFNLDGTIDFWSQVLSNKEGKIDTWAIFWYTSIFKNDGLCLNPKQSYIRNVGLDSSGMHCSENYDIDNMFLNKKSKVVFEKNIQENIEFTQDIKAYQAKLKRQKNIFERIINKASRVMIGKNIIR